MSVDILDILAIAPPFGSGETPPPADPGNSGSSAVGYVHSPIGPDVRIVHLRVQNAPTHSTIELSSEATVFRVSLDVQTPECKAEIQVKFKGKKARVFVALPPVEGCEGRASTPRVSWGPTSLALNLSVVSGIGEASIVTRFVGQEIATSVALPETKNEPTKAAIAVSLTGPVDKIAVAIAGNTVPTSATFAARYVRFQDRPKAERLAHIRADEERMILEGIL